MKMLLCEGLLMLRLLILIVTHCLVFAFGFGIGVYTLPILTASPSVEEMVLVQAANEAEYHGEFRRGLRGNDFAHWGEGMVSVSARQISHQGQLAPGPDYKLYLVDRFVEHEDEFLPIKESAIELADIKSFNGFIIDVPGNVDVSQYNTVLIWCEAFSQFITAAQYRP